MNIQEALSILGVEAGEANPETIKLAYKRAAQKYHPDRNPSGEHMMKLINVAYELVKNFEGKVEENKDFGDAINNALNAIFDFGLTIEVCGSWVWVTGNTKPHKDELKAAGFFWSAKKSSWYFRPANRKGRFKAASWSMEEIRTKFGSEIINKGQTRLAAFA